MTSTMSAVAKEPSWGKYLFPLLIVPSGDNLTQVIDPVVDAQSVLSLDGIMSGLPLWAKWHARGGSLERELEPRYVPQAGGDRDGAVGGASGGAD